MQSQLEMLNRVEAAEFQGDPTLTTAIHNTARAMVEQSLNIQPGEKVLIWFDPSGLPLVKELLHACQARNASVSFFERNLDEDAQSIQSMTEAQIRERFTLERQLVDDSQAILLVRGPENPEIMMSVPKHLRTAYKNESDSVHSRRGKDLDKGGVRWCLFLWPTEYEAKKEQMSQDSYMHAYFEACNQPWKAITEAQGVLISKLNAGKKLELRANQHAADPKKRTKLTMSIDSMTFCNSTIGKNYPGSEVFSAPVVDSVNGQLYAEGEYMYDGSLMKNIFLEFKDGKIIKAEAEFGNDELQHILSQGEGARYLGEVALGTNPGLTRRFFNDLLNEKVGGSFHVAIGHCYEYTTYAGEDVNVNNGNTSDKTPVHWDLTILMHTDGMVLVDDEVIQENGRFIDPALSILNPQFI